MNFSRIERIISNVYNDMNSYQKYTFDKIEHEVNLISDWRGNQQREAAQAFFCNYWKIKKGVWTYQQLRKFAKDYGYKRHKYIQPESKIYAISKARMVFEGTSSLEQCLGKILFIAGKQSEYWNFPDGSILRIIKKVNDTTEMKVIKGADWVD